MTLILKELFSKPCFDHPLWRSLVSRATVSTFPQKPTSDLLTRGIYHPTPESWRLIPWQQLIDVLTRKQFYQHLIMVVTLELSKELIELAIKSKL